MPAAAADVPTDSVVTIAIVVSVLGAALGGLLFGLDTAVISGATAALQVRFALSNQALGFTVASALIGTVVGSLGAGSPADRFGRRPVLLAIAALYILSALGTALAADWPMLLAFRLLGGVAIGAASVVTPVYIAEVSPARFRGRLVALNQLNIVGGILLAFLCDYLIAAFAVSQGAVIWVLISEVFPSAVRGKGQALGATTHWVMAAAITWAFPAVAGAVGGWVFIVFAAAMLLQLVWVLRVMPETRGVPLEAMGELG